jgi:hypothetical protein
MKKKSLLIVLLSLCIIFSASAQEGKLKFHSIIVAGISDGQSGAHLLLQTVNGVACKKWFSGIGFGADFYGYKSYPFFIDARRYFAKNNNGFLYGDLGYNLSAKNKPGKEIGYYTFYHFDNGIYTDIGIGYKIKFIGSSSFLISTGYSYKEINSKIAVATECLVAPCPVDYSNYKYGNGRVVLKAGIDF